MNHKSSKTDYLENLIFNLKIITHSIILATTPSSLAYPQNNLPHALEPVPNHHSHQNRQEWTRPKTYDEILILLEELESGELEKKYSLQQLQQLNEYLTGLAKEGLLPGELVEEMVLEEDTYDLMYGEESAFELTRNLENSNEYTIIPAVLNGYSGYSIVQCGKISHAWKNTKKFVKKHKKEIIIGAVVVVAVAVVVVGVVAVSSAGAAAAGAAGAAASSSSGAEKKESAPSDTATNETPMLKAAIDEQVSSFKEFMVEDKVAGQTSSPEKWDDLSFGEKAREFGANLAHQTFDGVSDLMKVVPQLCEEVKEVGAKFLPESLKLPNSEDTGSPIENYENLVAKGHQAIDSAFSTDQTELFTAEAKATDPMNNFAIGILPSPLSGSFTKIFSNTSRFKEAGKVFDRQGFTKAGRGLMKHGYREGSVFPKPLGNPSQINKQGQMILEEILNDPKNKVYPFSDGSFKVYSPNGRGVSFKKDGTFKGFIEWPHE